MSKIIYLGHASFLIKSNNYDVVIDPYDDDSVPNLTFPRGIEADAVFCSHDHYDHYAAHLVNIKSNPQKVSAIESLVAHDHEGGRKRGMNYIRMFNVDGYKVVHLGDTGYCPNYDEIEKFIGCDVLLAPINGFFTINPHELQSICGIIKPRIVIPMHYYMKEKNSGYPDQNMYEQFLQVFPNHQFLDKELDLDEYKNYSGALIFKNYLQ